MKKTLHALCMIGKYYIYGFILQTLFLNLMYAAPGNAQGSLDLKEVHLSLDLEAATLAEAFTAIKTETGFSFIYDGRLVKNTDPVNMKVNNQSLESILLSLAATHQLSFKQVDDKISVKLSRANSQEKPLLVDVTVKGTVVDDKGDPLPGASVTVSGTTTGTVTDIDGNYTLDVPDGSTLIFSYIGFETMRVAVDNRSQIDITLQTDMASLDEVVVVGFGAQKKRDITGAVARADIQSLQEAPNVGIGQSLQGMVPGLNVGTINSAGADPPISIRGATTLSGNQNVLIVLDGIIFNGTLASLNPADIESIDVLKDASATAIYGAQAANGVLLITTKKGATDKPQINFSSQIATQTPAHALTPMNRDQFLQKNKNLLWEDAYLPPNYITINPDFDIVQDGLDPAQWDAHNNGTDFDWWDAGTQMGYISDNQLSISGRTDNFNYLFSGGHTRQKGFIKNDEFTRKTIRINLESKIKPWLTLGVQSFGSFSDYSGEAPTIGRLMLQSPLTVPYDEEGNLIVNPNQNIDLSPFIGTVSDDSDRRNALFGNFYADIKIPFIEGLSYRLNYGHNYRINNEYNSNQFGAGLTGRAIKRDQFYYDYTLDNILTYSRGFGLKHDLNATLLYGAIERQNRFTTSEANGFNRMTLGYHNLQQGTLQFTRSGAWDEALLYQMGRINYKYDEKYLFTATVRRDGFSGFSEDNKYGIFPSLALGWILSEENFISELNWLNVLKLRASYGANGNMINRYASLPRVNPNIAYVFGDGGSTEFGQQVAALGNSDLRWERTVGYNYGADFRLFNGKLSGNVEYYHTTTNDLLFSVSIPPMTGFTEITSNVGEVRNRGIEFSLNPIIIDRPDFRWDMVFNFSRNVNEIKSLTGLDADGDGKEDDLVASNLFIGQPIGAVFGYETDGIYQIEDDRPTGYPVGSHRVLDQNGDGVISPDDRVILGMEDPTYRFSIFNTMTYKNFSLRVLI
ncbi:SusC/RagA family TonB-linked outer membrane protein, partial [Aquiflexum sp.]|uniref:SusC/RagA family TonB-linked outer membrane protein n=1 Tax=Aquiflexum sp. TaxID=1872584 RepID=UPI0035931BB4